MMRPYLSARLVRWGLGLLLIGTGPLAFIILAAEVGLWPDPSPNPIGPGLLAFVTFWPAITLIVLGAVQVRREQRVLKEP